MCSSCVTGHYLKLMGQVLIMNPAHTYLLQPNGVLLRLLISQLLEITLEALPLDSTEPLGTVDGTIVTLLF